MHSARVMAFRYSSAIEYCHPTRRTRSNKRKSTMNDTVNKTLEAAYANPQAPQTVAMIVAGIFVAAVFLSAIYTNILRDSSVATDKPFSLARTQLMWWTLVIGLCVI